jgi:hypothetical protein
VRPRSFSNEKGKEEGKHEGYQLSPPTLDEAERRQLTESKRLGVSYRGLDRSTRSNDIKGKRRRRVSGASQTVDRWRPEAASTSLSVG